MSKVGEIEEIFKHMKNTGGKQKIKEKIMGNLSKFERYIKLGTDVPMGKNCPFKRKQSPPNGSHKWETISESMESIERNVNGLHQTDIHIRLRDKNFHLWDPFEGEK